MREKKQDAGCGKSSMREVIFKNTSPDLSSRLTSTHSYETEHFRFFGDIGLNLWDCGGQWGFIDSYLTDDGQKTVFASCSALIYCFEVTKLDAAGRAPEETLQYFERCLQALRNQSPRAPVFILIQKMDLVNSSKRQADFDTWITHVRTAAGDTPFTAFGTSIHEDTLYRAWSVIIQILVPNVKELTKNLNILSQSCGAIETVIFEKTTFLLVAKSTAEEPVNNALIAQHNIPQDEDDLSMTQAIQQALEERTRQGETVQGRANRFELISRLIKTFKNDARRYSSEPFESLRMELAEFTLVLDALTSTSYVLVITSSKEPRITPEAIAFNITRVREHFENLQKAVA